MIIQTDMLAILSRSMHSGTPFWILSSVPVADSNMQPNSISLYN